MSGCAACAGTPGATHTCYGSGTHLASEAHASGEIEEIAAAWPTFEVHVKLVMQAADEEMVRMKLTPLVRSILDDNQTQWGDFTVTPRDTVTA